MNNFKRQWNKIWNIKKSYSSQGFIYLNHYNEPVCDITDKVKWLDKMTIQHWSELDADREALKQLNNKYPQYKGMIWLF